MKLGISSLVATVLKRHGDKIYNIMLVFVRKKLMLDILKSTVKICYCRKKNRYRQQLLFQLVHRVFDHKKVPTVTQ